MANICLVAFFISSLCIQWTSSQKKSAFDINSGKCENMEHDVILTLSKMGFTHIDDYMIDSPHVSCLTLSDNAIHTVSDRAFDLLPNLLYLDVSNNNLQKDKLFCVGAKTNIITLVLDNNEYNRYYNQRNVENNCSFDFPKLTHMYARGCRLDKVDIPYLHAPNLTHVYLSSNNIDSLDFVNTLLINTTHLYLDRNKIGTSVLTEWASLVHLDLSFNHIQHLCNEFCNDVGMSFSGATNLRYLYLAGNKISNVEVDTFDDMTNLTVLDLSSNNIIGFKKGTFDSLSSLQVLSLSDNYLKFVPDIYPLWSLKHLNLSFNVIEEISNVPTSLTTQLLSIDFSNNKISFITDDTFVNLTSLVYLNLSGNNLQAVSQNWCVPLTQLEILLIDGNHIENIASFHLGGAVALTDVFFKQNITTTLKVVDMYNISVNASIHILKSHMSLGSFVRV